MSVMVSAQIARRGRRRGSAVRAAPDSPRLGNAEFMRRAGVAVIALKLALVPLLFDPLAEDPFNVPKSVGSRAAMWLLIAIGVGLLAVGRSTLGRRRLTRFQTAALVLYVLVAIVSTLVAVDVRMAAFGAHHRYLGLTSIFDGVVTLMAASMFVRDGRDLRLAVRALMAGAAGVVLYAVAQTVGVDPWRWSDVASTIGNRGTFAGYLVLVAAIAVVWVRSEDSRPWQALVIAVGILAVLLLARSAVRGPLVAIAPALGLAYWVAVRAGVGLPRIAPRAVIGLALVGLACTAVIMGPRLAQLMSGADSSVLERAVIYEAALGMIAARPLLGSGPDTFAALYPTFRPLSAAQAGTLIEVGQTSAHSWVLHHAIGTGLVGLAALCGLIGAAARYAWAQRSVTTAVGLAMVSSVLLQGLVEISSVATDVFFWAGLGLCATGRGHGAPGDDRVDRGAIPAAVITLAAGLAVAATGLAWWQADRAVRQSDQLRHRGQLARAEAAALSATQLDSGRANNWNVLGLARSPESPARALIAFERAAELAPYESRYAINVVKELARSADRDPSQWPRARDRALSLARNDPRNAEVRMVLSYVLLRSGDSGGAAREAELASTLAPRDPQYYAWSAAIHEDIGDPATALARYRTYVEMSGGLSDNREVRGRLARLYVRAGDRAGARPLAAPRVVRATKACDPTCSGVTVDLESSFGMTDKGGGSAVLAEKYRIDGRELPTGTAIHLSDPRTVVIIAPSGTDIFRSGSRLSVRGITDSEGFSIEPDPTEVTIR